MVEWPWRSKVCGWPKQLQGEGFTQRAAEGALILVASKQMIGTDVYFVFIAAGTRTAAGLAVVISGRLSKGAYRVWATPERASLRFL